MSRFTIGDPAPWFISNATVANSQQDFIMGGYRAVLFFFGSSRNSQVKAALADFCAAKSQFEQLQIHFFGISIDPNDRLLEQEVAPSSYFHWLWDLTGEISIRYGLCQLGEANQGFTYDPTTFVLNENLRVLNLFALETQIAHVQQVLNYLHSLPTAAGRQIQQQAPVLCVPNVFPRKFCQLLIDRYQADGGTESGFMRQESSKTAVVLDPTIKRRRDWLLSDRKLLNQVNLLIGRRIVPEIQKAFQFPVTHFERYVVACYESTHQGFFQPHRDNTASGTAHRRFALTLNLNDAYTGGALRFPEYGADRYTPEPGSALIFSCSLLHEALPVTEGERFVLLSFLYGEREAKLRQQTQTQVVRAGSTPEVGNERIQRSQTESNSR